MWRDRCDGTLRGCILVKIQHKANYTQIEFGRIVFKTHYRGSPFLKIALSSLILSEIVRHPRTPIYVIGSVISHKAYLVGLSTIEYYPVYNKETPEHFKKMFAEYAASLVRIKGSHMKYNPETFVIEQEELILEESLSVVTERDLQNPHIKFFVERNPGWRKASTFYKITIQTPGISHSQALCRNREVEKYWSNYMVLKALYATHTKAHCPLMSPVRLHAVNKKFWI